MAAPKISASADIPWHAAYPSPRCAQPNSITRQELLGTWDDVGKAVVLVDLRRADHEGGMIQKSINLPAQSLYNSLETVYTLFKAAGVQKVVWYCGSSRGRGTRAAGWFADLLEDRSESTMESLILLEGIRGWATGGPQFVEKMVEYNPTSWS